MKFSTARQEFKWARRWISFKIKALFQTILWNTNRLIKLIKIFNYIWMEEQINENPPLILPIFWKDTSERRQWIGRKMSKTRLQLCTTTQNPECKRRQLDFWKDIYNLSGILNLWNKSAIRFPLVDLCKSRS
jgi:hypothetical protein